MTHKHDYKFHRHPSGEKKKMETAKGLKYLVYLIIASCTGCNKKEHFWMESEAYKETKDST